MTYSRRRFLTRSALLGCSLAASPLVTPVSFAAAPWDTRLVVIILRGGMDALDVVQPYGDPGYAGLRSTLAGGPGAGALDLDGFYAMHSGLALLMPLWQKGELGFVHAVSTPYRNKRSHFDGQDLLEAGTPGLGDARDGWLNRMLQLTPGVEPRTAFAVGQGEMKILRGEAPVSGWAPDAALSLSPQAERLAGLLMEDDPLFHAALSGALEMSQDVAGELAGELAAEDGGAMTGSMAGMNTGMGGAPARRGKTHVKIADYAAEQLRGDTRIAAFSINGWDTHVRQERGLKVALGRLSDSILALRNGVGDAVWQKTAVLAMTEFGRTARENGTGGTDHGTGGAMVMAGGAVRGGRIYGQWPGLLEADLYNGRDLMPTGDVRASAGWILRGIAGIGLSDVENTVFPGVEMGRDPGLLL